jgi:hypothetical protein
VICRPRAQAEYLDSALVASGNKYTDADNEERIVNMAPALAIEVDER